VIIYFITMHMNFFSISQWESFSPQTPLSTPLLLVFSHAVYNKVMHPFKYR